MRPVKTVEGTMVSLPRRDVDTDQIIPQKHLKRVEKSGYGDFLFDNWSHDDDGEKRSDFPLNDPARSTAGVMVTGSNFGCGSSREHAVWAILDRGIEAVIAPSFADIFKTNAVNNGLLLVELPEDTVEELHRAADDPGAVVKLSLEDQQVSVVGRSWTFTVDPETKRRLLSGLDMVGVTLEHEDAIAAFEAARAEWVADQ